MQPVVAVGLDGSPESPAAARWDAGEAEKSEVGQDYWAKRLPHTARAELQAHHPGLTIVGSLVADDARNRVVLALKPQAAVHHGHCPAAVVAHD